jgi:hypothetical protein
MSPKEWTWPDPLDASVQRLFYKGVHLASLYYLSARQASWLLTFRGPLMDMPHRSNSIKLHCIATTGGNNANNVTDPLRLRVRVELLTARRLAAYCTCIQH